MAKERSKNQEKESKSRIKFEDKTVDRWITEEIDKDFGIDLLVTKTKDSGESREIDEPFFVQLKSTESLNNSLSYSVDTDDLEMWINQDLPVLLAVYVFEKERFYWKFIQNFVWTELEKSYENWRENQDSYTINLAAGNSLQDLTEIEESSSAVKSRIIKKKYISSGSFEGIKIKDSEELASYESKNLENYKKTALLRAGNFLKSAEKEKAAQKFQEIYESPKNDEAKLRAIIGILSIINPINEGGNLSKIQYAREGASLAKEIDKKALNDYFKIEEQLGLFLNYSEQMKANHISKKVQEGADSPLSYIVTDEAQSQILELRKKKEKTVEKINERMESIVERGDFPLAFTAISNVIEYLALDTSYIIAISSSNERNFIENQLEIPEIVRSAELLLDSTEDVENRLALLGSLSLYNYYILNSEKAKELAKSQLKLAKEINDKPNINQAKNQLKQIENKPNPYERDDGALSADETTTKEYQEMLRHLLEGQNIDYKGDDLTSEAIELGLRDADPSKYFRKCKNIRIAYIGTSPLGKSLGLHTLGTKVMMCKHHGKVLQGSSLESMFQSVKQHCETCEECEPRSEDWECTVEWVQNQEEDDELNEIIDNIRRNQER